MVDHNRRAVIPLQPPNEGDSILPARAPPLTAANLGVEALYANGDGVRPRLQARDNLLVVEMNDPAIGRYLAVDSNRQMVTQGQQQS